MANTFFKKMVYFIGIIVFPFLGNTQASNFQIQLVMPPASASFTEVQLQKLESKIIQLVTNSNLAIIGTNNNFVIYPVVTIGESNIVENGMQNITVTSLDFSFFIKQIEGNMIFSSISKKIIGNGSNQLLSITNAFSQLNTKDADYKEFILKAIEKVNSYYNENCNTILQKADNLDTKLNYEQAIGLLSSVPPSCINCNALAEKKALEIFKKYQPTLCNYNLTKAKAAIAINDFETALNLLYIIDPTANCNQEVNKLIKEISQKVDKKQAQELDLTKLRINAIKEIGKSYNSKSGGQVKYNTNLLNKRLINSICICCSLCY
jgi:hypothetical protein